MRMSYALIDDRHLSPARRRQTDRMLAIFYFPRTIAVFMTVAAMITVTYHSQFIEAYSADEPPNERRQLTSFDYRNIAHLRTPYINERCTIQSFALYDGYQFVIENDDHLSGTQSMEYRGERGSLQECLNACFKNRLCHGVNYDGNTCRQVESPTGTATIAGHLIRSQIDAISFNIYAEKICITEMHDKCRDRSWAYELVPGYYLSFGASDPVTANLNYNWNMEYFPRQQVKDVSSILKCAQLCMAESKFICRSALYNATAAHCWLNNLNRHSIDVANVHRLHHDLSSPLRNSNKIKFTSAPPTAGDITYIENKCIDEPRKFCDFRQISNQKLKTVDSIHANVDSFSECRELCLANSDGNQCKSFDFEPNSGVCRLSHLTELAAWHIGQAYFEQEGFHTHEIATCYNVSISCEPRAMKVHIETSKLFNGKIYAKTQPKNCVNDIKNSLAFYIVLPYIDSSFSQRQRSLSNDSTLFECDTRQTLPGNFANDIVIQHHDLVLTTKDLAIGVYCKFDLQNNNVAQIDLKIQGDILTDKLKGSAELPELSLHVVDYLGRDIDEVTIGDMLRVQIRMSDETTYGIFVRNLIVKDSANQTNNFTLIDPKGCPVQMKMMREMRTLDDNSKSLESYLEAFTFIGGSWLIIEAEVETCLEKCRPMQCQVATSRSEDSNETVISYGRRRRRSIVTNMEQVEDGDILSMTMLSKSFHIRSNPQNKSKSLSVSSTKSTMTSLIDESSKSRYKKEKRIQPVMTTTTMNEGKIRQKTFPATHTYSSFLPTSNMVDRQRHQLKSASVTSSFSIGDDGYICFEPSSLILICVLTFCVQGIVFSILFYLVMPMKDQSKFKRTAVYASSECSSTESHFNTNRHHPNYNFIR